MPTSDAELAGIGVLVTRAAHQSAPLCELIRSHGGEPITFPALEICGPENPELTRSQLDRLDHFGLAIFISPNAVNHGLAALEDKAQLNGLKIATVGKSTARTLEQAGLAVDIAPTSRFDSEALLERPELQQVKGLQIIIFRGNGGRTLLGDTLQQRGAAVTYAEVYRRACPAADPAGLLNSWPTKVQIVTTTSIDILNNLVTLLGRKGVDKLRNTPLLVVSRRMQSAAQKLGCRNIILAQRADDPSIVEALCTWAATKKPP